MCVCVCVCMCVCVCVCMQSPSRGRHFKFMSLLMLSLFFRITKDKLDICLWELCFTSKNNEKSIMDLFSI